VPRVLKAVLLCSSLSSASYVKRGTVKTAGHAEDFMVEDDSGEKLAEDSECVEVDGGHESISASQDEIDRAGEEHALPLRDMSTCGRVFIVT